MLTGTGTKLARRQLLHGGLAALVGSLVASCRPTSNSDGKPPTIASPTVATPELFGRGQVELYSWFDLPQDDPRSRELSGIAWDAEQRLLWGVQDEAGFIVQLIPDREFKKWTFGPTIRIDIGAPIDLEGLVVIPNGFIVSSEDGPRIFEVDRKGLYKRDIPVPPRFKEARNNKSLESLTASPSGRFLFTTSEAALARDGSTATLETGTRVRIVRMDASNLKEVSEHVYLTDRLPFEGADWGVADLAAISDDSLLVLERGWSKGHGNTARIYQTSLTDTRAACLDMAELQMSTPVLEKTLRVDVGKLALNNLPEPPAARQPQASALLDNYEGIAIGPRLPDGRASILMVSDDNAHTDQVARILVLAV